MVPMPNSKRPSVIESMVVAPSAVLTGGLTQVVIAVIILGLHVTVPK